MHPPKDGSQAHGTEPPQGLNAQIKSVRDLEWRRATGNAPTRNWDPLRRRQEMPVKGDPHPQPSPERKLRPQHEKGERGLDFSQDLDYFLLPPPVGFAIPSRAMEPAGSNIPYPAKGTERVWEAQGRARG